MTDEAEIERIIRDWAHAVETGNRPAIVARHADDLLMFDFPDTKQGIAAYDKQWDFFYADPRGPISFRPREIDVTASDGVAFATCLVDCDGTSAGPLTFRLTTGLAKNANGWITMHEHHSVPTIEKRFGAAGPAASGGEASHA